MNVYEFLENDHKQVSEIFQQLMDTHNEATETRDKLFNKLKNALEAHTEAEEKVFYPALRDPQKTHDLTLEAIEEHHVIDQLLEELEGMSKVSDEWMAKLTVLKENVEHHVEEEENDLFPKARQVLSDTQADKMGARVEQEEKRHLGAA
jgi:hemerythrin superfamily protein